MSTLAEQLLAYDREFPDEGRAAMATALETAGLGGDVIVPAHAWKAWIALARAERKPYAFAEPTGSERVLDVRPAPKDKPYALGIIACSASKLTAPAGMKYRARDLYQGDLFKKSLEVAECLCSNVVILSARHGVVRPGELLEPYDKMLPTRRRALLSWGVGTGRLLREYGGADPNTRVLCLAPSSYWKVLDHSQWDKPLRGLGIGKQKLAAMLAERRAA